MVTQRFTHEKEVIAMAPLNAAEDEGLFEKQHVSINDRGELQYDFILINGRDWHFTKDLSDIKHDLILEAFKGYIRGVLKKEPERQEEAAKARLRSGGLVLLRHIIQFKLERIPEHMLTDEQLTVTHYLIESGYATMQILDTDNTGRYHSLHPYYCITPLGREALNQSMMRGR